MATQTQPLADKKPNGQDSKAETPKTQYDITKSGTSLETLKEVTLYKVVPVIPEIRDLKDAQARVGNDQAKLLKMIRDGLQAEAENQASTSEDGWKLFDSDGKKTETVANGALISPEVLNPAVLNMCKVQPFTVTRDGKDVDITWDEAVAGTEEKGKLKEQALEAIRENKKMVESLKRKQAAFEKERTEKSKA